MDNQILYPDAAQRIMLLMKNTFGQATFNAYFLGLPDNLIIPEAAFPCMIIDKVTGTFRVGPTQTDELTEEVYIHVLADVKAGFGQSDSDLSVKRQLQTLIEGRDPTTGYLLQNTIMYALRRYLTLQSQSVAGIVTINNDIQISYDAPPRPELPETREAIISISVTERQVVLNRQ